MAIKNIATYLRNIAEHVASITKRATNTTKRATNITKHATNITKHATNIAKPAISIATKVRSTPAQTAMYVKGILTYLRVRKDWESLCAQCGRCCFERITYEDGDTEIDYSSPCEYLDLETARCRVYEQRFEVCPQCNKVTVFTAMRKGTLPDECAYRLLFSDHSQSDQNH